MVLFQYQCPMQLVCTNSDAIVKMWDYLLICAAEIKKKSMHCILDKP